MLLVYQICTVVGGILVILAAVGGLDGVEIDTDIPFEADVELADRSIESPSDFWRSLRPRRTFLPFLSLRFWTFSLCFFGLAGLILTQMEVAAPVVMAIALGVGFSCGTGVAWAMQQIRRQSTDSLVRSADYIGCLGIVEIPFDATSKGKVQLHLKGSTLGVVAMTDYAQGFQVGDRVLVVSTANNRVWVVSEQDARQPSGQQTTPAAQDETHAQPDDRPDEPDA